MRIAVFLVIFMLSGFFPATGQFVQNDCFYHHYTGVLDTNMRLTMDLHSQNGKVSGHYFYSFELQDEPGMFHHGKTIPLTGTLDGDRLIIYEFNNTDSKFTGYLREGNTIRGEWQRRTYEDPIPFTLQQDYEVGSLPLTCIGKTAVHVLDLPEVPKKDRPSAKIELSLLYPDKSANQNILSTLDQTMSAFILNDSIEIGDPELLIENMIFDYFESYRTATEGIPQIERTGSFNWLKKISMEVVYNENSLLTLKFNKFGFTGGAHGVTITRYRVFDLRKQRPLDLSAVFIRDFEEKLNPILEQKLRKLNGIAAEEALRTSGFLVDSILYNDNFYVNNDGIGFYFNVYEIASYATGPTELFCTFYELKEILRPDHPFFWIAE
jgi:hypothetical protein